MENSSGDVVGPAPPVGLGDAGERSELPEELRAYLGLPGGHALILWGPTGTGKTTLAVELLRELKGSLILVTPAGIGPDERLAAPVGRGAGPSILHLNLPSSRDEARPPIVGTGPILAAGFFRGSAASERPQWIERIVQAVDGAERAYIVVDHWRPGPSAPGGPRREDRELASTADSEVQALRVALEGHRAHLILLADLSPSDDPISSVDGAIETGYEALPKGRIRLLTLQKLRGVPIGGSTQYPYTLEHGRFRCTLPMPQGFRPAVAPPEPSPEQRPGAFWPGSRALAQAFGWLGYGSFSSVQLGEGIPDYVVTTIATPLVAHALAIGGRVVWVPLPSCLPEESAEELLRWLPKEALVAGLRFLSAGGDERNPILDRILLDLPALPGPTAASGSAPRVGPAFTGAFKFLAETPPGRPALFVLSMDGLRAVAAVTGAHYDAATFPLVVARYAKLPGFHGMTFAPEGDPLGSSARGHAERVVRADFRHGRVFLTGVRPETLPYVMEWSASDPTLRLIRMS